MPHRPRAATPVAIVTLAALLLAGCQDTAAPLPGPTDAPPAAALPVRPVVVATFDTGANPLHPCWQRPAGQDAPWAASVLGVAGWRHLNLTFGDDYEASLEASEGPLEGMAPGVVHAVAGTSLLGFAFDGAPGSHFVDDATHGAEASSQIGCTGYGTAPEAFVLAINLYDAPRPEQSQLVDWVAQQAWIDVVHLNIQDIGPALWQHLYPSLEGLVASGKMVVVAGGNFYGPGETSGTNSIAGLLIAGANDNGGYTSFSYTDPHVVMDGAATASAQGRGTGEASFSGTSSASPRTSGYVAHILGELRAGYGVTEAAAPGQLLTIPAGVERPGLGPLADGNLTALELHEAIRKTADPNPHGSRFDGGRFADSIPQPAPLPFAFYAKMGYGEVSEHTWDAALAALRGEAPLPERGVEDAAFLAAESARGAMWP